jgi:hypothetical protein
LMEPDSKEEEQLTMISETIRANLEMKFNFDLF